jgi:hypothetical protein
MDPLSDVLSLLKPRSYVSAGSRASRARCDGSRAITRTDSPLSSTCDRT